jgi:hypothetical protein
MLLTDEAVEGYRTGGEDEPAAAQRSRPQRRHAAFKDGTLDTLATDHAPHHYDEKEQGFRRRAERDRRARDRARARADTTWSRKRVIDLDPDRAHERPRPRARSSCRGHPPEGLAGGRHRDRPRSWRGA